MELYSVGTDLLIHFNTTNPAKADPRGFVIDYEFSSRFVDVAQLLHGQKGVTHMRGTECDVRVESNRETSHYIYSPKANSRTWKGDASTFEEFAVLSDDDSAVVTDPPTLEDITCPAAWVGVATSDATMKATLSSTDESNFEATLCERIPSGKHQSGNGRTIISQSQTIQGSPLLGPYVSGGPRMVIQFGTTDKLLTDGLRPHGFKARVDFKTVTILVRTDCNDQTFQIRLCCVAGEPMGTSNECLFRFRSPMGFFNSPRYPANLAVI
ncbi:hypothetical protein OSTOST_12127 [Ostertagia ostertagi]